MQKIIEKYENTQQIDRIDENNIEKKSMEEGYIKEKYIKEKYIKENSMQESDTEENSVEESGIEEKNVVEKGKLYLCATPIGNLDDITIRVLNTLKSVDLIAAEDTRHSIKLLNHFDIKTPMTSYHEFNKVEKAKYLVGKLQEGLSVALITDAGTPGISDPGEELVKQCHAAGVPLTSLPGAAACVTALTISGQATRRFAFEAFLPADKKERKEILDELALETRTIVIHEAPHRIIKTLSELQGILGGDRPISICKELTKRHEHVLLTTIEEAIEYYQTKDPRGEYVLVIQGKLRSDIAKEKQAQWETMSVEQHVQMYMDQGIDKKEAMKLAAKDRGVSKRDIYQQLMV